MVRLLYCALLSRRAASRTESFEPIDFAGEQCLKCLQIMQELIGAFTLDEAGGRMWAVVKLYPPALGENVDKWELLLEEDKDGENWLVVEQNVPLVGDPLGIEYI